MAEDLIQKLEEVFPSYGLDGGVSLRQALLDDEWASDNPSKMQEAYQADITHDWKAIPAEELDAFFDSFSVFTYLDDKGWRYYLPAALRHSLRYPDSNCEFYTRISLLPGGGNRGNGLPEWDLNHFVEYLGLSGEQSCIVAKVLEVLRQKDQDYYLRHPDESAQLDLWLKEFCKG